MLRKTKEEKSEILLRGRERKKKGCRLATDGNENTHEWNKIMRVRLRKKSLNNVEQTQEEEKGREREM